jgi:hypothetical protein
MTTTIPHGRGGAGVYLLIGSLLLLARADAQAQPPLFLPIPDPQPDLTQPPVVPPDQLFTPVSQGTAAPASQPNRIRLFRIQPGFLCDPAGLDSDDKTSDDAPALDDDGPDWLTVAVGNDNPYFDFRRRTDPGGVGYTRVATQMQLIDTNRTALSVGLQAVTPSGQQFDGLADNMGPTVLSPAMSLFHAFDDTTALQAYVGKHLAIENGGAQSFSHDLNYGVAVQRALTTRDNDPFRNVYLSVGAVGQMRVNDASTLQKPVTVEMMPGLHYKMSDNWWISGALVLPMTGGAALPLGQQWQVTCSVQF